MEVRKLPPPATNLKKQVSPALSCLLAMLLPDAASSKVTADLVCPFQL